MPLIISKEHVNSVTRAMSAGSTAFADGDTLLGILHDPASSEARERYLKKTFEKKSQKKGG